MFRKILSIFLLISVACTYGAYAEAYRTDTRSEATGGARDITGSKDVFCDDFSGYAIGSLPPEYVPFNTDCGTVGIAEYEVKLENGKTITKNCLEIDDNYPDSTGAKKFAGPGFTRSFKEIKNKYAMEVRLMFVEESNPYVSMSVYTLYGNEAVTRLGTGSSTGTTGTMSSVGDTASIGSIEAGVWYTFRFIVDLKNDTMQLKVSSTGSEPERIYSELGLNSENAKEAEAVNKIRMDTQVYDGKIVVDYIKTENSPVFYDTSNIGFTHPDKLIIPPVAEAPVNKPVEGAVNICLNGEYLYSATPLYINNGKAMIYIRNFAQLFGGKYTDEGGLTVNGAEMSFADGSDYAAINGEKVKMDASAEEKDGKLFIPIRFTAEKAGFKVGWNGEASAVVLTGEEGK